MECPCPNCKAKSVLIDIDGIDFIQCPVCGWFEVQADGTMTACDPPQSRVEQKPGLEPEPPQKTDNSFHLSPPKGPALKSEGGSLPPPSSPPSDKPGDIEEKDNPDEVIIKIEFED